MKVWQIIPALLAAVVVAILPLQAAIAGENAGSCVESAVAFPELEWGAWILLPEWEVSPDIRDEASGSNPLMLANEGVVTVTTQQPSNTGGASNDAQVRACIQGCWYRYVFKPSGRNPAAFQSCKSSCCVRYNRIC